MSIEQPIVSASALTASSYLVLGLLAREGPSTPYELKRYVAATIGHFWSFPHAVLYKEPPRLAGLGLATEEREAEGRRRRRFMITAAGRAALRAWLGRPSRQATELRDPGLLQLFFADLEPTTVRLAIAEAQLAQHRAQLAAYEVERPSDEGQGADDRSIRQWRGVTLPMGLLYERAAIEFWASVVADVGAEEVGASARARAEDDGAVFTAPDRSP